MNGAATTRWSFATSNPTSQIHNAYTEQFNRTYRHDLLNLYLFDTLDQPRDIAEPWVRIYNERRPHESLGRIPPSVFSPNESPEILNPNCLLYGEAYARKQSPNTKH